MLKTIDPEIIKDISTLHYDKIFGNSSKFEKTEAADSSNKITNHDSIQKHKINKLEQKKKELE